MCDSNNNLNSTLATIGQVLIRCFFMGMVVLLFWSASLFFAGDLAYRAHSAIAPISRSHFDVIHYTGMLATKSLIFLLFLLPYAGIRMVLKKRR